MPGTILLSSAYMPPVEYFAAIIRSEKVYIEREETYLKQSYRNRCYILSADGPQNISVPVYQGSFHSTPVKEVKIDYSKRWQQVHIGALKSSYNSSPYFLYYFEIIETIILKNPKFLLDLNMDLLLAIMNILKIKTIVSYTKDFMKSRTSENDLRYSISPKIKSSYAGKSYTQVFNPKGGFTPGLSIVDLIFNTGPDAILYL